MAYKSRQNIKKDKFQSVHPLHGSSCVSDSTYSQLVFYPVVIVVVVVFVVLLIPHPLCLYTICFQYYMNVILFGCSISLAFCRNMLSLITESKTPCIFVFMHILHFRKKLADLLWHNQQCLNNCNVIKR